MTRPCLAAWRTLLATVCMAALLGAGSARAEKADRDKPINFSADQPAEVDFEKRVGTLRGNVVITQGTMTIRADRIDFKQNPDNSLSATAYGNPISFRQKKDDSDEYFEGYAQKAAYDGEKQTLELFDRALLRQGTDEIRSNYISYNSATGVFKAEGRPDAPGVEGPGARVRGVFQPRGESPLGPKPDGQKPDGKESPSPPKTGATRNGAGTDAKPARPLALTPDAKLPAK